MPVAGAGLCLWIRRLEALVAENPLGTIAELDHSRGFACTPDIPIAIAWMVFVEKTIHGRFFNVFLILVHTDFLAGRSIVSGVRAPRFAFLYT